MLCITSNMQHLSFKSGYVFRTGGQVFKTKLVYSVALAIVA